MLKRVTPVAVALTVLTVALGTFAARAVAGPAAELVAQMPAASIAEGQKTAAELIKLGAPGIAELCGLLVPPGKGDDTKAQYALSGVVMLAARPDGEADRAMVSMALVTALDGTAEAPVKALLLSQLQLLGKDEAVAPLARFLTDDVLCEPAAQALQGIRTPAVGPVLAAALATATGRNRVTICRALAELRTAEAVPRFIELASSQDRDLRLVALYGLANCGAASGVEMLRKARTEGPASDQSQVTALCLLCARRLNEAGQQEKAVALCRDVMQAAGAAGGRSGHVLSAALATLASALGEGALPELLATLDRPEKDVRSAALDQAARLPGVGVTPGLVAKLSQAPVETRAEIITALADRADKAALTAVIGALKDQDKGVRLAAIPAARRLGGDEAVPALLQALVTDQDDEIRAVKEALLTIPGDQVLTQAAAGLGAVSVRSRVALLEVLAARRARANAEAVYAAAKDADAAVRTAALDALREVASPDGLPRLVALLQESSTNEERAAAQKTIAAVARQLPAGGGRSAALLAALPAAAAAEKRLPLLQTLARIGGQEALNAVLADVNSGDAGIKDGAVRALADWTDESAAPELLKLARTAELVPHQVLALRGFVRVVSASGMDPGRKLGLLTEAMAAAKRPDEKKLVLAALGDIRTLESARTAAAALTDEALQTEACQAIARIVCPRSPDDKGLVDAAAVPLLQQALKITADAELRKRLEEQLAAIPVPDTLNLALGKPATTSCPQQGDHSPDKAVDGNCTDRNSAWFGDRWPSWYQVDLQAPVRIGAVHVFFYWDGARFYQYTVDVSTDGNAWKTVVDMSGAATPTTAKGALHSFAAAEARHVRVSIQKNSVNEAVHLVELKVYAEGAAPTPPAPPPPPQPDAEGFIPLFNGRDLTGWVGSTDGYLVKDEVLVCTKDKGGMILTEQDYGDFVVCFEFKLTPGANNGLALRTPPSGNPAYEGMEIQVLDDSAEQYKGLKPYQFHGSIYGVVPAEKGHQKPVGEWNEEEVTCQGRHVTVRLNGAVIVDADLDQASTPQTMDGQAHPGLKRDRGRIGFLGHGAHVEFRRIRVKPLR